MTGAGTILAVLLHTAAAVQAAPAAPEAQRELLDAFRSVCGRVSEVDQMRSDALGAGWTEIEEDAEPRMAKLLRDGRAAMPNDTRLSATVFRAPTGAGDMFMTQTRVEGAEGSRNVCRIYQFGPATAIEPELAGRWMGRPATLTEDLETAGWRHRWEPGWGDGVSVEIVHIAPGPAADALGFNGNIFVARAAESSE